MTLIKEVLKDLLIKEVSSTVEETTYPFEIFFRCYINKYLTEKAISYKVSFRLLKRHSNLNDWDYARECLCDDYLETIVLPKNPKHKGIYKAQISWEDAKSWYSYGSDEGASITFIQLKESSEEEYKEYNNIFKKSK